MDPKMVPEFDPQNGAQKWHPKGWLNILFLVDFFEIKIYGPLLGAIFGPHFGGQILAPFLGPFFNPHFEVQK